MARSWSSVRVLSAFALVLVGLFLGSSGGEASREHLPGILGTDDRVILDTSAWPWAAVGRVNRETGGFCTGTLVASNLVLTAAHCLYDGRTGNRVAPGRLHFVGGYRRGGFVAHAVARAVFHPAAFSFSGPSGLRRAANDWALLVLAAPVATRPIPVRSLSARNLTALPRDRLMRAGYSQDRPHLLSLHNGCGVSDDVGGGPVMIHTCDATRGDSGSPLIIMTDEGPFVVGVIMGVTQSGTEERGLAINASAFVETLDKFSR
jgi:protease YdgD